MHWSWCTGVDASELAASYSPSQCRAHWGLRGELSKPYGWWHCQSFRRPSHCKRAKLVSESNLKAIRIAICQNDHRQDELVGQSVNQLPSGTLQTPPIHSPDTPKFRIITFYCGLIQKTSLQLMSCKQSWWCPQKSPPPPECCNAWSWAWLHPDHQADAQMLDFTRFQRFSHALYTSQWEILDVMTMWLF